MTHTPHPCPTLPPAQGNKEPCVQGSVLSNECLPGEGLCSLIQLQHDSYEPNTIVLRWVHTRPRR